jgi:hypothetical protein
MQKAAHCLGINSGCKFGQCVVGCTGDRVV